MAPTLRKRPAPLEPVQPVKRRSAPKATAVPKPTAAEKKNAAPVKKPAPAGKKKASAKEAAVDEDENMNDDTEEEKAQEDKADETEMKKPASKKAAPPKKEVPAKAAPVARRSATSKRSSVASAKEPDTEAEAEDTDADAGAAAEPQQQDDNKDKAAEPPKEAEKVEVPKAKFAVGGDPPEVGDIVDLDGFGGEVITNDGKTTSLKALVDESKSGVVLFTYPKASTPGCTTQACGFRDAYTPLTAGGLSIFGLSTDSPKANTSFKDKQKLPYALLCDPKATLIAAVGLKKSPRGTTRGVFVISKQGKVLAREAGSPAGTVDVVRDLVEATK